MALLLPILKTTDFTGVYRISTNTFNKADLEKYITEYEHFYIRMLMGDKFYDIITTDSTPAQKFTDLINGVTYVNTNGDTKVNKGLKEVLKGLIYYHYVGDDFINTTTGNVNNINDNSSRIGFSANSQFANSKYNLSAILYDESVWPFLSNYERSTNTVTSSSESGGTYTLVVPDTRYLENADTVSISGKDYTVSNVVVNTSFDITADSGLGFTNKTYTWQPFKDIVQIELGAAWI